MDNNLSFGTKQYANECGLRNEWTTRAAHHIRLPHVIQ